MESDLISRIYHRPVQLSTDSLVRRRPNGTRPLGYETAFGAYMRKKAGVFVPGDFANSLAHFEGMTFESFVTLNRIELLDDEEPTPAGVPV